MHSADRHLETEHVNVGSSKIRLISVRLTANPVSVEDEGKLICAELHIWLASGSGPAHSHVSSCNGLKFKVPFSGLHCVRPLYSEEADLIDAEPLNHLSYRAEGAASDRRLSQITKQSLLYRCS